MSEYDGVVPAEQAVTRLPNGQFAPGVSGNARGRPSAGASVVEWINQMAAGEPTLESLRQVRDDETASWQRRAAAKQMVEALEAGDVSDFEMFLDGKASLGELRHKGIKTDVIKRAKKKRKTLASGVVEEEREIELRERSGEAMDRILDRTLGKPLQAVDVTSNGPAQVVIVTPLMSRELPVVVDEQAIDRKDNT